GATAAGIADLPGRGRSANWIDYDNDGDLDLFKANATRADGPDKLYRNNSDGTFADVSSAAGLNNIATSLGNVWGDYDDDGDLDLVLTGSGSANLYRNNGDGTFTDRTSQSGLSSSGRAVGADFGDYDNDGDLDLFIARSNFTFFDNVDSSSPSEILFHLEADSGHDGFDFDSSSNSVLFDFLNGGGSSVPLKQIYVGSGGVHPPSVPFSSDDITNPNGEPSYNAGTSVGVFVWQTSSGKWKVRISNKEEVQGRVSGGTISNVSEFSVEGYNPTPRANFLYENQGDGTFVEVGSAAGVNSTQDSPSGTWFDYDNDGLLDLYVVNSGNVAIGNQPNHLYRNNGDGTFTDVAAGAGVTAVTSGLGDCALTADYDHNGFLDLFVTKEGKAGYHSGPHKLYRNNGNGNNWLQINLVGTTSNAQGIGARVELVANGVTQTRQMNNGMHYRCQNSPTLHFGLAGATEADQLTVTWPSGQVQTLQNVPANQFLTITEEQLESPPIADFVSSSPDQLGETTTFTNLSSGGNLTFEWNFGDGSPLAFTASPTHTYVSTGTFTVALTATNSLGTATAFNPVTITDPSPDPDPISGLTLTSDAPTSLGQPTTFTASVSSGSEITYDWDLGDGTLIPDGGAEISHTYAVSGTFNVSVTASNSVSAESTAISVIVSDPAPAPSTFYFSLRSGAASVGSVTGVNNSDILRFDGTDFAMFFDGSDVGLSTNIGALHIVDAETLLFSVRVATSLPGLGPVDA
ncbi:MAG: FG-GAP-like repeat-containing protein, partial [Anaerolineae bacterium]|nr:FG-GAP-like repeat-containing protein [Anaerolineae bacterium]